jgi:hypothetical protein
VFAAQALDESEPSNADAAAPAIRFAVLAHQRDRRELPEDLGDLIGLVPLTHVEFRK